MSYKRKFIVGAIATFIVMMMGAILVTPLAMWVANKWSAWPMLSYFISIPVAAGLIVMLDN